ncbi:hypothetical protein JOM56_007308 [Amanita muscaria]
MFCSLLSDAFRILPCWLPSVAKSQEKILALPRRWPTKKVTLLSRYLYITGFRMSESDESLVLVLTTNIVLADRSILPRSSCPANGQVPHSHYPESRCPSRIPRDSIDNVARYVYIWHHAGNLQNALLNKSTASTMSNPDSSLHTNIGTTLN